MLKLMSRLARRLLSSRKNNNIMQGLDVGEGSRVGLSNLDGMFPHLVHIGKNCIFAPRSIVLTHDASFYTYTGKYLISSVTIGDNCFIGYGAIIMPGVTIGSNTVVGAGCVVTKDMPANSVVAGVPAKVLSSLSEYLEKNKGPRLVQAPYAGKQPVLISPEDVAGFRECVYSKFGIEYNG